MVNLEEIALCLAAIQCWLQEFIGVLLPAHFQQMLVKALQKVVLIRL
jgi:hypothetical protein